MRCRRPPILTTVIAFAAVSLLAAGCGGASSTTVATTTAQSGPLAYSHCMRSHGVPSFPDPNSSGGNNKPAIVSALQAVGNSEAQAAQTACLHVNGGSPGQRAARSQTHTVAMLAFARCLRSHGFPSFPDPTSSGELTHEMVASAGVNLHQPAVRQAGDACVSVTHGVITEAIVARFVAGS
jgi:hypothetical protein